MPTHIALLRGINVGGRTRVAAALEFDAERHRSFRSDAQTSSHEAPRYVGVLPTGMAIVSAAQLTYDQRDLTR